MLSNIGKEILFWILFFVFLTLVGVGWLVTYTHRFMYFFIKLLRRG